jgi:hypothetical protein
MTCLRLDDSPWGDILQIEFFNNKFDLEFKLLNQTTNNITKVLTDRFGYQRAAVYEAGIRTSTPSIKQGFFIGSTDDN